MKIKIVQKICALGDKISESSLKNDNIQKAFTYSGLVFLIILFSSTSSLGRTLTGHQVLHLYGSESMLKTHQFSTLYTYPGSTLARLESFDDSTINIKGGDISWIFARGNSKYTITNGTIAWLKVYDNNTTDLHYASHLSWLLVNDDSVVNIYGSQFSYSGNHLSGKWQNGESFSFWALREEDLGSGGFSNPIPENLKFFGPPLKVSPSVIGGNGSLSPNTQQNVSFNETTQFTLRPSKDYHIDSVGGSCGGIISGDTYTTSSIMEDCSVIASFAYGDLTVSPSVSGNHGTISPNIPQSVEHNGTAQFTLVSDEGFRVGNVSGTCGITRSGNVYTTAKITKDCTVIVEFVEYIFPWILFNSLFTYE